MKKLGGWRRARAVLTLGTPHHGTPAAWAALPIGLLARSIWQMMPASRFVRELQRGAWPAGVRLVSLYSKSDRVARFPSTLIETFNLPSLRNVEVDARGHRDFLYRKRVYDVLLAELRAGEVAAPVAVRAGGEPLRLDQRVRPRLVAVLGQGVDREYPTRRASRCQDSTGCEHQDCHTSPRT